LLSRINAQDAREDPPMPKRFVIVTVLVAVVSVSLAVALPRAEPLPADAKPAAPARILPGIQADGSIRLPNAWSLRPAGKHLEIGDFPVNSALHPSGDWLVVQHAGYSDHEIVVIQVKGERQRVVCRVPIAQTFYGLCFSPDGNTLYVSGGEYEVVHAYRFEDGLLSGHRELTVAPRKDKFIPSGIAVDKAGKTLFAAGVFGDAVCVLPVESPDKKRVVSFEKDTYPFACLPHPDGKRLFVSLWGRAGVGVIDLTSDKLAATWKTESHPTEMALSPDGKTLFVACSNSTRVSVLDANDGQSLQTLHCALHPKAPSGNTPNSLCLSGDGKILFVANADASNIAVFNVKEPNNVQPMGFIPTGWYPTSVRYSDAHKQIYVCNGKGLSSHPNPQGPHPHNRPELRSIYQYIAHLMRGTLSTIEMPTPEQMAKYTKDAYACSPLREDNGVAADWPEGNPIPKKVGDPSPIKHVIYVIKENRTYDQLLGDMKEGNGDPNLCLFGEKVTPNHHKLSREFVLLDNFYVDGEVSADGHQWTCAAYATDFVEKVWPLTYRGSPLKKFDFYPSEGNFDSIARPTAGYIWDRCAEAKVSYRSYGEFVTPGKTADDPSKANVKALEGHIDEKYRGWDLNYPDQKRADRFIEELKRFEKDGDMPSLILLRLPNDHTAGTKPDMPTPTAMIADNDLALGRVVEAVSKSKFWKDTAIFVLEDDAQNGPDHVDAHRSVTLVVSAYTKRKHVDSTMYSTSSMLRTMELILGLKPMSQFDAAATPMYHAFQKTPDFTEYKHVVPDVDLTEKNKKTAWGAHLSESFDLTKEDQADDLLFNEVIWRSVKGPESPMPAPVRAAFVTPNAKHDDD
jgi:DNA-binding beta-propeller fold protein YncE